MRTEQPLYTLFSTEERQFLARMFAAYPTIGENFDRYLTMPAEERYEAMWHDMDALKRSGWVRRGVKAPESNAEHSRSAARLAVQYRPEGAGIERGRLIQMLLFHDTPEVIVTDFTPQDGIDTHDKHRLELLAARVIYAQPPLEAQDALGLIEEFIAQKTPTARWAHDADKLDAVATALRYEGEQPALMGKLFRIFADWTKGQLVTERGHEVLGHLEAEQDALRNAYRAQARSAKSSHEWSR